MQRTVRVAGAVMVATMAIAGCGSDSSTEDAGTTAAVAEGDQTQATASATSGERSLTLTFWPSSQLDLSSDAPAVPDRDELPPAIDLVFYWDDPADCFIWDRTVDESIGGGIRRNTASDFVVETEPDGAVVFTYTQNAGTCDEEFEGQDGEVKTFRSDHLIVDETTGQTGDALWVAVTDVQDS